MAVEIIVLGVIVGVVVLMVAVVVVELSELVISVV